MKTQDLIDTLTRYALDLAAAESIWKDPNLSAQGKRTAFANARQKAADKHLKGPLAAATRDLERAEAEHAEARKWNAGELESDPAELSLAWETLQPLVKSGMTLEQVSYYATEPVQLAALHRYGPAHLTLELIRANDNSAVSRRQVTTAVRKLEATLADDATRLGVGDNTAKTTQAAVETAKTTRDLLEALASGDGNVPLNLRGRVGRISPKALEVLLEVPGANKTDD